MKTIRKTLDLADRPLTLEIGRLAGQANCAVYAQYAETAVLVTVCSSEPKEDLGYFPLTVEYEERYYAGGKISTSRFVKREGKPTEEAVLKARLIDRSVRPLFPKDYFNEVQLIVTVLSVDQENDPDVVAAIAASCALACSDITWNGPVGTVRIGHKDGNFTPNPRNGSINEMDLDLVVTSTRDSIIMMEAGGKEVSEEVLTKALEYSKEWTDKVIGFIEEFVKEVGKEKKSYEVKEIDATVKEKVIAYIGEHAQEMIFSPDHVIRESAGEEFKAELYKEFEGKLSKDILAELSELEVKKMVRKKVVEEEKRVDGRSLTQIRPISIEVAVLPRTHGSAIFKRGETQTLTIVTLGSTSLEQLIENMEGEETKRFMHHYNFRPYSTGEVSRIGPPKRREIGHGALAEKALKPIIPAEEPFPYAIRLVSETLSSSGSTSMAAVCASTLALMDAGVPITSPVAGIAMGIIFNEGQYKIMTDIQALEDFYGDMDFKVAGTEKGITAIQLDIKSLGLTAAILSEALVQAREGRIFILNEIRKVLPAFRAQLSPYAPRAEIIHIDPKKIGALIGPGGKMINQIIEATGAAIDVENDGAVSVTAPDETKLGKAIAWIKGITEDLQVGQVLTGKVTRLLDFGAIVEFFPGKDGMVHISQIADHRIDNIEDVLKMGQEVTVRVVSVDDNGRVGLSMRLDDTSGDRPPEPRRPFSHDRNRGPAGRRNHN